MYQFRVKTLKREATNKNEKKEGESVYKYFSTRKACLSYCYKYMALYYEDIQAKRRVLIGNKISYIVYTFEHLKSDVIRYKEGGQLKSSKACASYDLKYKTEADSLKTIAHELGAHAEELSKYIIEDLNSINADSIHLLKDKYIIYKTALIDDEIEDDYSDLIDTNIILL